MSRKNPGILVAYGLLAAFTWACFADYAGAATLVLIVGLGLAIWGFVRNELALRRLKRHPKDRAAAALGESK